MIRLSKTKTGKRRDVPLKTMAHAVLAGMTPAERSGFVFPGSRKGDKPVSHSTICNAWNRMRAVTNLQHARPHDLRHAFATRAVEAALSLPAAMLTTGHASTAAFMRYFEPNARAARAAADVVEQAYGKVVHLAAAKRRRSA